MLHLFRKYRFKRSGSFFKIFRRSPYEAPKSLIKSLDRQTTLLKVEAVLSLFLGLIFISAQLLRNHTYYFLSLSALFILSCFYLYQRAKGLSIYDQILKNLPKETVSPLKPKAFPKPFSLKRFLFWQNPPPRLLIWTVIGLVLMFNMQKTYFQHFQSSSQALSTDSIQAQYQKYEEVAKRTWDQVLLLNFKEMDYWAKRVESQEMRLKKSADEIIRQQKAWYQSRPYFLQLQSQEKQLSLLPDSLAQEEKLRSDSSSQALIYAFVENQLRLEWEAEKAQMIEEGIEDIPEKELEVDLELQKSGAYLKNFKRLLRQQAYNFEYGWERIQEAQAFQLRQDSILSILQKHQNISAERYILYQKNREAAQLKSEMDF